MAPPPSACPSCGARVDAVQRDEAFVYSCHFCKANIPIDPLVARPQPVVRAEPIQINPKTVAKVGGGVGCFILVTSLLPVVLAVGFALKPFLSGLFSSRFGNFPIDVAMNDDVEIDDRTASSNDTLVTVGINGKLTLRRCKLSGPLIVKAGTNAEITIVDSTLQGTKGVIEGDVNLKVSIQNSTITSGEEIVDSPVNPTIEVTKGSKLTAAGVAFPMENNPTISIDASLVEGKLGGIAFKNNGHVKMTGDATVKSDGVAIELDQSGHVAITGGRVEGKVVALKAGNNAEGTLRSTSLVGKEALELGANGRLVVSQTAIDGEKKLASSAKIDAR
jgi:hypothetical protein